MSGEHERKFWGALGSEMHCAGCPARPCDDKDGPQCSDRLRAAYARAKREDAGAIPLTVITVARGSQYMTPGQWICLPAGETEISDDEIRAACRMLSCPDRRSYPGNPEPYCMAEACIRRCTKGNCPKLAREGKGESK